MRHARRALNEKIPIAEARADLEAANQTMGQKGLRVLAFATRLLEEADVPSLTNDPMAFTKDLSFVGMAGIIDPLRAEAKSAVQTALGAGIDVRMITGDHAVTARAIGETLELLERSAVPNWRPKRTRNSPAGCQNCTSSDECRRTTSSGYAG